MEVAIGNNKKIRLVKGDITKESTDVIVNAANPSLRGGGGVDGAIHRAGGPAILQECIEKYPKGCLPGEARITTAGKMQAKWVIHTPGPIWRGGGTNEETILKDCYKNSMELASKYNATSIAFPSISTGIYGYPIEKASKIAIKTVVEHLPKSTVNEVHFVLFSEKDFGIYKKNLAQYLEKIKSF
ncbi:MAG: O-acetyl-ADP-ribose deacetylase [Candidatus Hodarchaeales archaeon]